MMKSMDKKPEKLEQEKEVLSFWRTHAAFYILAVFNSLGGGVMLSAAHDILHDPSDTSHYVNEVNYFNETKRDCNTVSAGAVLVATSVPAIFTVFLAAFLPLYVHVRIFLVTLLNMASFLLVGLETQIWMGLLGVGCNAFAGNLGEVTFLTYISQYDKSVLSAWAAGRGASGLLGAFALAALTSLGMTPNKAILIMLIAPIIVAFTFWIVLKKPKKPNESLCKVEVYTVMRENYVNKLAESKEAAAKIPETKPESQLMLKIKAIPTFLKYMLPMGLVHFFQFFINQGLTELVEFDNIWLDHSAQYRWNQVMYRVGFFAATTTGQLFNIKKLWILVLLQFVNLVLFASEALLYIAPNVCLVFAATLWEGIISGVAYVNIYKCINSEVPPDKREVCIGLTTMFCSLGTAIAGFLSIPVHDALCQLPKPDRLFVF